VPSLGEPPPRLTVAGGVLARLRRLCVHEGDGEAVGADRFGDRVSMTVSSNSTRGRKADIRPRPCAAEISGLNCSNTA
jgi:hypothetical protein